MEYFDSDESDIANKCLIFRKNSGFVIHHEIILPSNSTVSKFRKKIVKIRNEDEILSDVFYRLNAYLFVGSIIVIFILIMAYKKFYNRYRGDPNQNYTSFFSKKRFNK